MMGNPFAPPPSTPAATSHPRLQPPPTPGSTVFFGPQQSPEKRLLFPRHGQSSSGSIGEGEDETMLLSEQDEEEDEDEEVASLLLLQGNNSSLASGGELHGRDRQAKGTRLIMG